MQDHVPPQTCYHDRPGRSVTEPRGPSPHIEGRKLHVNRDGLSLHKGTEAPAPIWSPLWVGQAAGDVGRYGDGAEWATDLREDDGGSLVVLTEPLAERLEILGVPLVHVRFSSDKPQALVCARLNDVALTGGRHRSRSGF